MASSLLLRVNVLEGNPAGRGSALAREGVAGRRCMIVGLLHWYCPMVLQVADMVEARVEAGKNYGVILIPEGLIEQVHDVSALISGECKSLFCVLSFLELFAFGPCRAPGCAGAWGMHHCSTCLSSTLLSIGDLAFHCSSPR